MHCAHLRLAIEVREHLSLDRLCLMPAPNPRFRTAPVATIGQRLELLEAAVAEVDGLSVDAREIDREGPTQTVDTLSEMAAELHQAGTHTRLVFVMGMDAFSRFDAWHEYQRILELAHLVVVSRPGAPIPDAGVPGQLLSTARAQDAQALHSHRAGKIYLQTLPELDISATQIREKVSTGQSIQYLVPEPVCQLIEERKIYHNGN